MIICAASFTRNTSNKCWLSVKVVNQLNQISHNQKANERYPVKKAQKMGLQPITDVGEFGNHMFYTEPRAADTGYRVWSSDSLL